MLSSGISLGGHRCACAKHGTPFRCVIGGSLFRNELHSLGALKVSKFIFTAKLESIMDIPVASDRFQANPDSPIILSKISGVLRGVAWSACGTKSGVS